MGSAALILFLVFFFIIAIPCIGVAMLGSDLVNRLAFHPSKTPAIQLRVILKLVILEIISFGMLMSAYHILADYGQGV